MVSIVLAGADCPGENGFVLAVWLRTHHPEVDIILAGSISTATRKAGDLCRKGPSLQKPYDHQLVLDYIRRLNAALERSN